jgi:hypothetical protein
MLELTPGIVDIPRGALQPGGGMLNLLAPFPAKWQLLREFDCKRTLRPTGLVLLTPSASFPGQARIIRKRPGLLEYPLSHSQGLLLGL